MKPCSFWSDSHQAANSPHCSTHGDRHPFECAEELRKELDAALLQVRDMMETLNWVKKNHWHVTPADSTLAGCSVCMAIEKCLAEKASGRTAPMTTTTVKERPILFSEPMVHAILDGRKTQTRRVVRIPSNWHLGKKPESYGPADFAFLDMADPVGTYPTLRTCPYGQPGDLLWVRETWVLGRASFENRTDVPLGPPQRGGARSPVIYKASPLINKEEFRWKPSIYMPRWASRLTLEVTGIRVQRVQEISHEDAVAEGCYRIEPCEAYPHGNAWGRAGYAALWDEINKKRGYGWDKNQWVWVVAFKRCGV